MKYSKLFGKTLKDTPKDATLASHKLLYQAGFIRESTAGRYYLLPLGMKVQQKMQSIIKEEMDATGAQEMLTPVLHPKALWVETNRTTSVGFELMSIKDRNEAEFVLGGTAEEMLVDVVRKFQISYKDLPFNLYQFSIKFRDEMRARGGLLRLREFIMKDAYSFHATEDDFKKEYKKMWNTYATIITRFGLEPIVVEADNGYIGGEYCHEFIVESPIGENKFFTTEDGSYAAHEEVAVFLKEKKNIDEALQLLKEVKAVRGTTMEDGVKLHKLPLWQQIKDVLFVDETGRFVLSIIRGDYDVNETKLLHLIKAYTLRHATEDEIRTILHSEPGFISPVGIKEGMKKGTNLIIVADDSLRTIHNAYGGANKKHLDLFNMNIDRDYKADIEGDIALVREGDKSKTGKKLMEHRGIEVGNIFQLGFHYSTKMKDATFTDDTGKQLPYYMGCYGFGLARTLTTIVEKYHDEHGIMWPESVAPYHVFLISLKENEKAEKVYKELTDAGIEVLYDDREDASAGQKFADADLIGIPVRLVVSAKTAEKIEFKKRTEKETELLSLAEVLQSLKK
ncbi:MAG: proline--tRNA ligase [Candidatus Levyibacteriota bacterium]